MRSVKEKIVFLQHVSLRGRAVVARRAHNPEVAGSSPAPATKKKNFRDWHHSLHCCCYRLFRKFFFFISPLFSNRTFDLFVEVKKELRANYSCSLTNIFPHFSTIPSKRKEGIIPRNYSFIIFFMVLCLLSL